MMILGGRTKQLDIFGRVTGFTSDFVSFIVVELIRFFHRALRLINIHRQYFNIKLDLRKECVLSTRKKCSGL